MDSHQWRDHQQSPSPALTFSSPKPITITKHPSSSPLPRMGYFTMAQWQELELQALIYKYMMAGVSVPVELIQPVKRSLLNASACYHHPELFQHLQASFTQTGEWGRSAVDPEPGRCRRTDGKKWRCSRDVMVGHKYCERHVHRGRNRSRKPVETPTLTSINSLKASASSPLGLAKEKYLNLSGSLPTLGIFPRSQRHSDVMKAAEERLQSNSSNFQLQELEDKQHEGYVLQRFFDEWPKSQQESNDSSYTSRPASALHPNLSSPGYAPSDFSLKLSTGNSDCSNHNQDDPPNNNSWSAWVRRGEASMGGGPLAEALSSSASTRSPTSVLHKLNGSVSESSSISP